MDSSPSGKESLFRPGKPGLRKMLGDLEAAAMEVIWAANEWVTVRQVADVLKAQRGSAYTTVMTIMGNLTDKNLLRVDKSSQSHKYEATMSEAEFTRRTVGYVIDQLLHDFADPALAHFAERLGGSDAGQIESFAKLIQARRSTEG